MKSTRHLTQDLTCRVVRRLLDQQTIADIAAAENVSSDRVVQIRRSAKEAGLLTDSRHRAVFDEGRIYRDRLCRLRVIDRALSSPDGLNVATAREVLNVADKTIRRDLAYLGEVVCGTVAKQELDSSLQPVWVHRYIDNSKRLFF